MKIHKLTLKNITSLKGEHSLDFDNDLYNEDIFAITGETGSGKSSILTAITLALFGQSYKKSLTHQDFVTLGTEDGFVTLIFSVGGETFEAHWSSRIKKKGGDFLKKPDNKRYLKHNGLIIERRIEDIIGLDFDQFCKTVILNQGEFSKFITSSFRERKDILEKLFNNSTISIVSELLNEKLKNVTKEREILEAEMKGILPFTEDELKEIQEQFTKQKTKLSTVLEVKKQFGLTAQLLKDFSFNITKFKGNHDIICSKKSDITYIKEENNEKRKHEAALGRDLELFRKHLDERKPVLEEARSLFNRRNQTVLQKDEVNKNIKRLNTDLATLNARFLDVKKKKTDLEVKLTKFTNNHDIDTVELERKVLSFEKSHTVLTGLVAEKLKISTRLKKERINFEKLHLQHEDLARTYDELKNQVKNLELSHHISECLKASWKDENCVVCGHKIDEHTLKRNLEGEQKLDDAKRAQFETLGSELLKSKLALEHSIKSTHEDTAIYEELNEDIEQLCKNLSLDTSDDQEALLLIKEKQEKARRQLQELREAEQIRKILIEITSNELNLTSDIQRIQDNLNVALKEQTDASTKLLELENSLQKLKIEGDPTLELDSLNERHNELQTNLQKLTSVIREKERDEHTLESTIKNLAEDNGKIEIQIKKNLLDLQNAHTNDIDALTASHAPLTPLLLKLRNFTLTHFLDNALNLQELIQESLDAADTALLLVIKEHEKELTQIESRINDYNARELLLKEKECALAKLMEGLENIHNLHQIIGRQEFRNYVLKMIETHLIQYANEELNQLCDGRYKLTQFDKGAGQDFYVIDYFADGLTRKISSLSGGETFLVSLAMALSLAEMSRGGTEINSFFIDEGFGNLDPNTLEEAFEILMKIRNRGKSIGLISHVRALTDKIPVNILLQKNDRGHSKIQVRLN